VNLELAGQAVVVFGAAEGIGRAIAEEFAAEGAQVTLADRNPAVESVAEQLAERHGATIGGAALDVTDEQAVRRAAGEAQTRHGRIDHVVYAVGVGSGKTGFPFWKLEPADWPRVWQVNVLGAVHVAHAFAPRLAEARAGSLLLLSSVAGQIGSQTDPPYSASKAALINFAQCAAKDLAPFGVRVNTICPGMVRTGLAQAVWRGTAEAAAGMPFDEWAEAKIRRLVPLGCWQEPRDIAALAVFLASSRGASITGQTLNVDGGFVMHW
jgi:NAD(P)-dependent dehydrogenase (short-subunit alcohol dehydrogenase family)